MMRGAGAILIAAAMLAGGCSEPAQPSSRTVAGAGPTAAVNGHVWRLELAQTYEQRYQGLGGRTSMADDAGMLFIYDNPQVLDFCMRGCFIDLDIAFLDEQGVVVATHTMKAESDRVGRVTYSSGQPAQYALEVAAGSLARHKVKVGSQIRISR
ncbi:MAG: DUF192 domain-containing protein [Planctomycetaceae bacterium]|nr:DUF192 domain-containing protein [Planctomycetaceae bacterium]